MKEKNLHLVDAQLMLWSRRMLNSMVNKYFQFVKYNVIVFVLSMLYKDSKRTLVGSYIICLLNCYW